MDDKVVLHQEKVTQLFTCLKYFCQDMKINWSGQENSENYSIAAIYFASHSLDLVNVVGGREGRI